ncbi:hypothetical protein AWL63_06315 [Sphingomonas panacis]|uniref:Glyoxalase-related protein domain-containing protein n=1 Tax=Sphingomonas panacis TaxID=1560345 RepID=A0A1B3Z879_9SPHN|nr:glyoxalase superfamily protein [Sphingomonas panacis]AOH83645.1 hypothetical protein AWL63_06315 [Sphingomonas panacis]
MKIEKVKNAAKRFKRALLAKGVDITHTLCLEAIAAGLGFRSYHALQLAAISGEPLQWMPDRAVRRLIQLDHMRAPTRQMHSDIYKPAEPLDRMFLLGVLAETPLHFGAGVDHV